MFGKIRRLKLKLATVAMLSLTGSILAPNPALAYPSISGSFTGTSIVGGFTADLWSLVPSPYSQCEYWGYSYPTAGSFARVGSSITATGLREGQTASASIQFFCTSPQEVNIHVDYSGRALILEAANTPTFSTPFSRNGGFSVGIPNYDPNFTYSAASSAGAVSWSGDSVYVSGLQPDESATLTVTTSRPGYHSGSATVSGSSRLAAPEVQLSEVRRTVDGIELNILNIDQALYYTASVSPGSVAINRATGLIKVTGIAPGQTAYLTITASGAQTDDFYRTITGTALQPASSPSTFSSVTNTLGVRGTFSLNVTNYDPEYTYAVSSNSGIASMTGGLITISEAATGSAEVTVVKSRQGYEPVTQTITHQVPSPPATPAFPSAFATNATTAFVTWGSVEGATGYAVTATPGGQSCTAAVNFCNVTGLSAGTRYTFSIVATKDGLSSSAASTDSVLMGDQLTVGGSITGTTWKIGTSVFSNALVVGDHSVLSFQWYRCSSAIGTQVAPPSCDAIGGANSSAYTLSASDVGKFLTVHLSATGGAGVVTKTLANGQVALAADAAGLPAVDPEGKPVISNIPDRQVSVVGGTEIVINGTGFSGVTGVTVNGVAAKVLKSTDTSIVVSIPASTTQGLVDLVVTTAKGVATASSALAYVATPIALPQPVVSIKVTKSAVLKPYVAKVVVLSTVQKKEIKTFVSANSKLTSIKCAATTNGVKKSSAELKLAVARAKAACAYAKTLNGKLQSSVSGIQGKTTGKVSKVVKLTLTN